MKELVRMLENASYFEGDLAFIGIRTDIITVVLEVLREELKSKDAEEFQPVDSEDIFKVNRFLWSAMWVMKNRSIRDSKFLIEHRKRVACCCPDFAFS